MAFNLLEKFTEKLETSKGSSFKGFFFGVLIAVAFWLVYRSRKRLEHRKDYLEARAESLAALDTSKLALDTQEKIIQELRMNKNAAKVITKKISQVDNRIESIKRRIDSARSIDELEGL